MKIKIFLSICIVIGIFMSLSSAVSAHPGNTAADGGHYCWTNCEYWGEVYGERHFHGAVSEPEYEYYYEEPEYDYYYEEPEPEPEYEYIDESDFAYDASDVEVDASQSGDVANDTKSADKESDSSSIWVWLIPLLFYGTVPVIALMSWALDALGSSKR